MTDEENKLIEEIIERSKEHYIDDVEYSVKLLISLIEKQSKEIEELKEKNEQLEFLYSDCCKCLLNTVNKDKIKAKVEDILNSENGEAIEKLIEWQSLLEKE